MKLLAIETATEACSAALSIDGEITQRYEVQARKHTELILPMMDGLLAEAGIALSQLDALAFGRGPGAFTGVRVATGVVQGAAFAADLPVVPVSTLAALAQRHYREQGCQRLLPAFDARMGELYWGAYLVDQQGLVEQHVGDQVAPPEAVTLPDGENWHAVGTGWGTYAEVLKTRLGTALASVTPDLYCAAHDVALLGVAGLLRGEAVSAEQALPVYLRDQVASKPKQ
ncbi:MAG: tRNA (adenosine(37)-N6)-threonylcarbamoyltransferase complex dimerization subunit type 1 TsaB [Sedimenticola sp.]